MPLLQLAYTDRSGTMHPQAVFEVVAVHVELSATGAAADYKLVGYHDQPSRDGGLPPFEERPFTPLTPDQIAQIQGQFAAAFYTLLLNNTEFLGATILP